jgi:polyisoprenyl-teichoic acid--peptidoglycan teichoic acid transferase
VTPFPDEPPRLARSMFKRFAAAAAAIVFLTAGGTATAVLLEVDSNVENFLRYNKPIEGIEGVLDDVDPGDPQTILLLGSDRRWGDTSAGIKPRSDTIILVRLDPSKEATAILSIPRDLKVTYERENGGTYEDKINAAYEKGGPRATVRKVKELMQSVDGESFPIHHVVNVNFGGFTRAVKRLGCFYVDVDRRYFNDNQPPRQSIEKYATIDLQPGYQRLCGQDSLDFVRFRHLDTDIVRGARQQHYLSQAKDQIGVERLFRDRGELLELFGRYTDTDIRSNAAILRLLKLSYESSRSPLRRVRFRADLGESFVTISEENLRRTRDEFLDARASEGATGRTKPRANGARKRKRPSRESVAPGLDAAGQAAEDQAVIAAPRVGFPVYYPRYIRRGGRFYDGFSSDAPRVYDIYDEDRRKHRAYRMVVEAPGLGEYYGIQGMSWRDPPVLAKPSEVRVVGGRRLMLFRDGSRLRMVAWRTDNAVYWVSNTLLRSLTNRQMIGIARSLTRIGDSG